MIQAPGMKHSVKANGYSVLVIEQNGTSGLCEILESGGHLVTAVTSGAAAMELLAVYTPQLIVTELVLPDMNGLDFLRLVKPMLPGTPVILLADPSDEINITEGLELGAEDFLLKPCRPGTLFSHINKLRLQEDTGPTLPVPEQAPAQALKKQLYGLSRQWGATPPASERQYPGRDFGLWLQMRHFSAPSVEYSSS